MDLNGPVFTGESGNLCRRADGLPSIAAENHVITICCRLGKKLLIDYPLAASQKQTRSLMRKETPR